MKIHALLVTALMGLTFAEPALCETVLGRWCDRAVPNMPEFNYVITLIIGDDGTVSMKREFLDGSKSSTTMDERSRGLYLDRASSTGDRYLIVPNTGNLQLIDNDGLIREATRLENTSQKGECK